MSEELEPGVIRDRRQLLTKLAGNTKSPELAELAKELLSGRTNPQEVMLSGRYDEVLNAGSQAFTTWYSNASEQEKDEAARIGETRLAELAQEEIAGLPDESPVAEPRPLSSKRRDPDDGEDFSQRDWVIDER